MPSTHTAVSLISETFNEWLEDKAERLGASLAYYAAFSIAPLLIIVLAIVDFFYRGDTLAQVRVQLTLMFGANAADAIVATIKGAQSSGDGVSATVISAITLFIGATAVFTHLQDAMNTIWEVTPNPRKAWLDLLRNRVLSFAMVLGVCFLLLVSLVMSAALAAIGAYFTNLFPALARVWPLVDFGISFAITTLLFAMIFKFLPDVEIAWSDVWIGAGATAVLFAVGKIAIGLYLARSSFSSAYGAAGSVLVLLAWVYYSSQILFLGAEFTQIYARHYGRELRPARGAIFLAEETRIRRGFPHTKTVEDAVRGRKVA
jgi:membrane protein